MEEGLPRASYGFRSTENIKFEGRAAKVEKSDWRERQIYRKRSRPSGALLKLIAAQMERALQICSANFGDGSAF